MARLAQFACVLLCVFGCHGFEETQLYGVSHVAITVADLTKSSQFYTGIGGMKIDKLSTDGIFGDGLYYGMFQKQIMEAEAATKPLADYAVCDIKDDGTQEVAWDFILFEDSLIQLIQCQKRDTDEAVVFMRENHVAAGAAGSYGHIGFWIHSEADVTNTSQSILKMETDIQSPYAGFQTGRAPPATEAERLRLCETNFGTACLTPMAADFSHLLVATRGVTGEKVEISWYSKAAWAEELRPWCMQGAIHKEMYPVAHKKIGGMGLNHIGRTVQHRNTDNVFLTKVIGAKYQYGGPLGPEVTQVLSQDDIFEAKSLNIQEKDYPKFGILTGVGQSIHAQIDFYLMDNVYLETYTFMAPIGSKEAQDRIELARPDPQNISPGYDRTFVTGLWVYEDQDLDAYSGGLEMRAFLNTLGQVKTNRADGKDPMDPNNKPNSVSLTKGHLEGYNFVYFNSPSGDSFSLVQFKGKAKMALEEAMDSYNAITTAFAELNPYQTGDIYNFCCDLGVTATKDGSHRFCPPKDEPTRPPCPTGGAAMVTGGQLGLVLGGLIALFVKHF